MTRVAVLGLGRMGAAMAAQLVRAGHDLLVWNRSTAGYQRLAEELAMLPADHQGPHVADTPARTVAGADMICTVLADAPALQTVLFGPDGVADAIRPGAVVCDLATIGVTAAVSCAERLAERDVAFLDAPVSGSVPTVRARGLMVMVGGSERVARTVEPMLGAFARTVLRVGGTGSGQAMKLAVNSVVHIFNAALGEAIVLAERGGVPRGTALEALANSAVAAPFLHYKRAAFEDPSGQPVAFTVDLMRKDLDLVQQFANSKNCTAPLVDVVAAVSSEASAAGFGDHDMSAIAEHHRARHGRAEYSQERFDEQHG